MLTLHKIRSLRPRTKPYKVFDDKGLFLLIQPNGSLLWRFRYSLHGRDSSLSLGKYPQVGLRAARAMRNAAYDRVANGISPAGYDRKVAPLPLAKTEATFRAIADEYIGKMETEGKAPATMSKLRWFADLLDALQELPSVPVNSQFSPLMSWMTADPVQLSRVGTTRPTPFPDRVGAKAMTCSGPSWRR